jgi:hypothetical protein
VYLIPQGGAAKGQSGSVELLTGAMVDYYIPASGPDTTHLDNTTREFIDALKKGDQNLRTDHTGSASLGGRPALLIRLTTKTSNGQD